MILDRLNAAIIVGARVWFCRLGTAVAGTGGATNTVSDTVVPELPDSYAEPGAWVTLGKIRTAKPQTDFKTSDVEGVNDSGVYKNDELKLATKRKLQFSTNDVTAEAFELTFGLTRAIESGMEAVPFESGNDSIEGWLVLELTDAYRTETNLMRILVRCRLSLQNPLEAKSDPAQADYEAIIIDNRLARFLEGNLVPAAQAGA